MEILKILSLIFISATLCIVFKEKSKEYSLMIIVVSSVLVLTLIVKEIIMPISIIEQKIESYGIDNNYFKVALKALGIGYITSFISDSCKDAGQTALAHTAELAGKCAIFLLSFPLVLSLLETAVGFVK
jgi:stage III sporulation protein AD